LHYLFQRAGRIPGSQSEKQIMVMSEDIERLDSQLQHHKEELRQDMEQIRSNVEAARETVSPKRILLDHPFLILGLAALGGFILGNRGGKILAAGKPAAKAALSTVATQAAMRAVRGY